MTEQPVLDEILTSAQAHKLRNILGRTPAVALPLGGMGYGRHPGTVDHVLVIMDSMAGTLRDALAQVDQLGNDLSGLKSDLAAVGRIVALVQQAAPQPYQGFEQVHHTEAGELEKYIGYETQWQDSRWTINTMRPGQSEATVKVELTRLDENARLDVYELEVTKAAPVDIYPPKG